MAGNFTLSAVSVHCLLCSSCSQPFRVSATHVQIMFSKHTCPTPPKTSGVCSTSLFSWICHLSCSLVSQLCLSALCRCCFLGCTSLTGLNGASRPFPNPGQAGFTSAYSCCLVPAQLFVYFVLLYSDWGWKVCLIVTPSWPELEIEKYSFWGGKYL